MRIILEFDCQAEHDAYLLSHQPQQITGTDQTPTPVLKIPDISRKRGWSQYEDGLLIHYYPTKTIRWIASQLRKTPASVNMRVGILRKAGADLPKKRKQNGEIKEEHDLGIFARGHDEAA